VELVVEVQRPQLVSELRSAGLATRRILGLPVIPRRTHVIPRRPWHRKKRSINVADAARRGALAVERSSLLVDGRWGFSSGRGVRGLP
jgi:hypothetical protein